MSKAYRPGYDAREIRLKDRSSETFTERQNRLVCFIIPLQMFILLVLLIGCEQDPDQAFGTLEWDRINSLCPASEVIVDIQVKEGHHVSAGSVLLKIDDRKISAQYRDVKARLEQASWLLKERVIGPRPQDIAQARARLEAAKATMENNKEIHHRQQRLFDTEFTSREQLDIAQNNYLNARERVNELTQNLDELLTGTRIEQIEQARAGVESLTAQLEQIGLQRQDYTIRATRDGLVDSLPFKSGDKPPAHSVVCTLLSGSNPWARVYITEQFRSQMQPGSRYRLRIDGQQQDFTVQLRSISSEPSFTPYYALSKKDRSRLSYVAKLDVIDEKARELTAGTPVQLLLEGI